MCNYKCTFSFAFDDSLVASSRTFFSVSWKDDPLKRPPNISPLRALAFPCTFSHTHTHKHTNTHTRTRAKREREKERERVRERVSE